MQEARPQALNCGFRSQEAQRLRSSVLNAEGAAEAFEKCRNLAAAIKRYEDVTYKKW